MATSGIPIPAFFESSRTVSTSQRSAGVRGDSITFALVLHLATGLEISSDTMAPAKPKTAAKASSEPYWIPFWAR